MDIKENSIEEKREELLAISKLVALIIVFEGTESANKYIEKEVPKEYKDIVRVQASKIVEGGYEH